MNESLNVECIPAIACSALLGHCSWWNLLVIALAATGIGAFVIMLLKTNLCKGEVGVFFDVNKLESHSFTKWTFFAHRWFKLRFLELRMILRILLIRFYLLAYQVKLITKHGRDWRLCVFDYEVVEFLELFEYDKETDQRCS
jgi:hypothetical protein